MPTPRSRKFRCHGPIPPVLDDARGLERLSRFLDSLGTESPESDPEEILESPESSESVGSSPEVERRPFANRLEAGVYLHELLEGRGSPEGSSFARMMEEKSDDRRIDPVRPSCDNG